jgi:hypothetical protein
MHERCIFKAWQEKNKCCPLAHIYHEIICKALSCGGLGAFEVISVDTILDTFGSFLFRTK